MTPRPSLVGNSEHGPIMRRFTRPCLFCGGTAAVLAPEGSDDLDVEAEFSSAARAFGNDDETEGVACYRCARKRWAAEGVPYECCGIPGGCGGPCAAFPCWELTT